MSIDIGLSRREATLRSAATASLAGIALVQAIELPPLLAQGRPLTVLSLVTTALCVGVAAALAVASAGAAPRLWRAGFATPVAGLPGGAAGVGPPSLPRARGAGLVLRSLAGAGGEETTILAAGGAALAAAALVAAVAAGRPTRARLRRMATVAVLLLAIGPGVAGLLLAAAPDRADVGAALATGAHVHHVSDPDNALVYRAIPGHHGGQLVLPSGAPAPRPTTIGVVLALAAAA